MGWWVPFGMRTQDKFVISGGWDYNYNSSPGEARFTRTWRRGWNSVSVLCLQLESCLEILVNTIILMFSFFKSKSWDLSWWKCSISYKTQNPNPRTYQMSEYHSNSRLGAFNFEILKWTQDLHLPWWCKDPCEVHVRHHDHRDEATEGPRCGLVLLPEKVIFQLGKKKSCWFADLLLLFHSTSFSVLGNLK